MHAATEHMFSAFFTENLGCSHNRAARADYIVENYDGLSLNV